MTVPTGGPPRKDAGPATGPAPNTTTKSCAQSSARDHVAGLRRRRGASWRIPGGDPWRYSAPPPTDRQIDGWTAATLHLLDGRLTPLVPAEVRRAWWRRGGSDRALAERMHRAVSA